MEGFVFILLWGKFIEFIWLAVIEFVIGITVRFVFGGDEFVLELMLMLMLLDWLCYGLLLV